SLKTSIKTITNLSDTNCLEIHGASLVNHLKSDFTLLLQNDIKVWAANIKTPKYGLAPKF
ncbi:TPA: hypothetical protein ACOEA9_004690, partial [Enterobacter bugandensis]